MICNPYTKELTLKRNYFNDAKLIKDGFSCGNVEYTTLLLYISLIVKFFFLNANNENIASNDLFRDSLLTVTALVTI